MILTVWRIVQIQETILVKKKLDQEIFLVNEGIWLNQEREQMRINPRHLYDHTCSRRIPLSDTIEPRYLYWETHSTSLPFNLNGLLSETLPCQPTDNLDLEHSKLTNLHSFETSSNTWAASSILWRVVATAAKTINIIYMLSKPLSINNPCNLYTKPLKLLNHKQSFSINCHTATTSRYIYCNRPLRLNQWLYIPSTKWKLL